MSRIGQISTAGTQNMIGAFGAGIETQQRMQTIESNQILLNEKKRVENSSFILRQKLEAAKQQGLRDEDMMSLAHDHYMENGDIKMASDLVDSKIGQLTSLVKDKDELMIAYRGSWLQEKYPIKPTEDPNKIEVQLPDGRKIRVDSQKVWEKLRPDLAEKEEIELIKQRTETEKLRGEKLKAETEWWKTGKLQVSPEKEALAKKRIKETELLGTARPQTEEQKKLTEARTREIEQKIEKYKRSVRGGTALKPNEILNINKRITEIRNLMEMESRTSNLIPYYRKELESLREIIDDSEKNKFAKEIPTITSQEQWEKLPSGSVFMSDGRKFRKP